MLVKLLLSRSRLVTVDAIRREGEQDRNEFEQVRVCRRELANVRVELAEEMPNRRTKHALEGR